MIGLACATTSKDSRWNECYDINTDDFVGIVDLTMRAVEIYPANPPFSRSSYRFKSSSDNIQL